MTDDSQKTPVPVVFVSYSHDTTEHKRWVGELASRLVKGGVEIILDQWDTGLGDDLPKFMEKSVERASRVLLVCSDAYVQKADDGTGGAGYEAMIVTGELAKNLGMNKFIPIIRQPAGSRKKPKFLETKLDIDFSDNLRFEEKLDDLLREIHKAPKFTKPPLGTNPFESERRSASAPVSPGLRVDLSLSTQVPGDAREAYFRALELARSNDRIMWRKLLQRASSRISEQLNAWKNSNGGMLPTKVEELPQWVLPGVTSVSPVMAIALAGVESQSEFFRNQVGLIDEFLRPSTWELSGTTIVTQFPEMVAFAYQALLGAVALQTEQADIALRLAWVEIPDHLGSNVSSPLFRCTRVTGWPESLNHTCTIAWAFLLQLPEHWPWLNEIFGDAEHFKAALCAYYAVLNIVEFVDAVEHNLDISSPQGISVSVPVSFTVIGNAVSRRASRLLEDNKQILAELWHSSKVDQKLKLEKWGAWEGVMGLWISNVYRGRSPWRFSPFHSALIKSL